MKLFDSELKVMDVLWTNGDMPARQIAAILTESIGWNVNTTYTLIKRCIAKNAIERTSRASCATLWFPSSGAGGRDAGANR